MEVTKMTDEQWMAEYKPILEEEDGKPREFTYEHDNAAIRHAFLTNRLWTLLDVDGKLIIVFGHHIVNRFEFWITEKPCLLTDRELLEVLWFDEEELDN